MKNLLQSLLFAMSIACFGSNALNAQDVQLRLSETALCNMMDELAKSKVLSYSHSGGSILTFYNIYASSASVDIHSGNQCTIYINFTASANVNLYVVDFNLKWADKTLLVNGDLEVQPQGSGFKIVFSPTSAAINDANSLLEQVLVNQTLGFVANAPEISTTIDSPFFSNLASQYFTSSTPVLSTTSNEVILSFTLADGPRYINVYNDVLQYTDIGTIQNEEGTDNYVSYYSPKVFEWSTGSTHKVQTPLLLMDSPNGKGKYRSWFNPWSQAQTDIAPRRIQLTVGSEDGDYRAKFDQTKRVQLSNSLEGCASGGTVSYESTSGSSIDDYDFQDSYLQHSVTSSVPNGTLGYDWSFVKWSDDVATQNRTVVLNSDVNVQAFYKAHLGASGATASGQNNQRRLVYQAPYYYMTYESAGRIWLTRSSNGTNWDPEILLSDNSGNNHSPSITASYVTSERAPVIGVVWEKVFPGENRAQVVLSRYYCSTQVRDPNLTVYDCTNTDGTSLQPNVTMGVYADAVVWRYAKGAGSTPSCNEGLNIWFYNSLYDWCEYDIAVPNTDASSHTPAIAMNPYAWQGSTIGIVWEQNGEIEYSNFIYDLENFDYSFSSTETVSSGSALYDHKNPSITYECTGQPRPLVAWQAFDTREPLELYEYIVLARLRTGSTWGTINEFTQGGNEYTEPSITCSPANGHAAFVCKVDGGYALAQRVGGVWSGLTTYWTGWRSPNISTTLEMSSNPVRYMLTAGSAAPYNVFTQNTGLENGLGKAEATAANSTIRRLVVKTKKGEYVLAVKAEITNGSESRYAEFNNPADTIAVVTKEDAAKFLQLKPMIAMKGDKLKLTIGKSVLQGSKSLGSSLLVGDGNTLRSLSYLSFADTASRFSRTIDLASFIGKDVAPVFSLNEEEIESITAAIIHCSEQKDAVRPKGEDKPEQAIAPLSFALHQNYPNPFNPTTNITYDVKEQSRVRLAVYDMLGRRVSLVVDEQQGAGSYSVTWNAAGMASGTYLIRLEAIPMNNPNKPFTAVHKAVVMK